METSSPNQVKITGSFRRRNGTVGAEPRAYTVGRMLSYAGLYKILQTRFAAAKLDTRLTPHGLRHSFITLAIKGGASIAQTQAAARHQDPRTTIRYAHELIRARPVNDAMPAGTSDAVTAKAKRSFVVSCVGIRRMLIAMPRSISPGLLSDSLLSRRQLRLSCQRQARLL
jgi:Phage integrase family